MNVKRKYITWKDVEVYIDSLVIELEKRDFKPRGVYGLPRGGLIPAVMLSHRLGIPLLGSICDNAIVIDDIADTGRSLYHFRPNETMFIDTVFITTMFYNSKRSMVKPDFFKTETDGSQWIVFPWEYDK